MTAPTQPERVVRVLDYHLRHRRPLGWGEDPFHTGRAEHPMAVALYASGLSHLYAATGERRYANEATQLADRLIASGHRRPEGGLAWGLGFRWHHRSADEPFAITTAIAARALADVHETVGHKPALAALGRASRWLTEGLPWRPVSTFAAPWYSPTEPYVLPNVAAMVAVALRRAARVTGRPGLECAARSATEFVLDRQDAELGCWRYGYAGVRRRGRLRPPDLVDALHMAYTVEGPIIAAPLHRRARCLAAVRSGLRFIRRELVETSGRLRERMVVARRDDRGVTQMRRAGAVEDRRTTGVELLVAFLEESRVAGYGALIGALARAPSCGLSDDELLERLVTRVLTVHARDIRGCFRYLARDPQTYPRQEAHVFEGLAAYVRAQTS